MESIDRVRQTADRLAAEVLRPRAAEIDATGRWPEECFAALKASGLTGLTVPAQWGGMGQACSGLYAVCESLGAACASTAISFGMHCVGTAVIAANPEEQQARRYLVPIARGEHITTLALSEAGTGALGL